MARPWYPPDLDRDYVVQIAGAKNTSPSPAVKHLSPLRRTNRLPNSVSPITDEERGVSPISNEQLAAETKGIYAGLLLVEAKCISIHSDLPAKTTTEDWQTRIALHRALLYEHNDFLMATQYPASPLSLKALPEKYSMPARMRKHGIHAFLAVLRHRRPKSQEFTLAFIYVAYQMVALLYTTVPSLTDTWIECLGDLARYRIAIGPDNESHASWGAVAARWYTLASDRPPTTGRLHHYLGILERPSTKNLCSYSKSLTSVAPFSDAQDSLTTEAHQDHHISSDAVAARRYNISSNSPLLASGQPDHQGNVPSGSRTFRGRKARSTMFGRTALLLPPPVAAIDRTIVDDTSRRPSGRRKSDSRHVTEFGKVIELLARALTRCIRSLSRRRMPEPPLTASLLLPFTKVTASPIVAKDATAAASLSSNWWADGISFFLNVGGSAIPWILLALGLAYCYWMRQGSHDCSREREYLSITSVIVALAFWVIEQTAPHEGQLLNAMLSLWAGSMLNYIERLCRVIEETKVFLWCNILISTIVSIVAAVFTADFNAANGNVTAAVITAALYAGPFVMALTSVGLSSVMKRVHTSNPTSHLEHTQHATGSRPALQSAFWSARTTPNHEPSILALEEGANVWTQDSHLD